MQQLTERELKSIAYQRAWRANKTVKKSILCAVLLLPFVLLDMWLIYSKTINDGWGFVIFGVIMIVLWTSNYLIRRKEVKLTGEIFKELKGQYGL